LIFVAFEGVMGESENQVQPEKVDAPGIENFSRITGGNSCGGPLVGFGGTTEPRAMAWLKKQGFATVINLRLAEEEGVALEDCRAAAEAVGLKYVHLPFSPKVSTPAVVDAFLAAVTDKANQPVYMHCGSATRAAALWMSVRLLEDGCQADTAIQEAALIARNPDNAIAYAMAFAAQREKDL
jgi:uncharacterized protein (TIGR01244 family)